MKKTLFTKITIKIIEHYYLYPRSIKSSLKISVNLFCRSTSKIFFQSLSGPKLKKGIFSLFFFEGTASINPLFFSFFLAYQNK